MKKSELKTIIKDCVKEVLFEEGILSDIIAEVAFGITKAQNLMVEQKEQPAPQISKQLSEENQELKRKKLLETKRKMLDAIGNDSMNHIFEGTEPLSTAGSPGESPAAHSPLSGIDPRDSGVDITGLFNLAGNKWKHLK